MTSAPHTYLTSGTISPTALGWAILAQLERNGFELTERQRFAVPAALVLDIPHITSTTTPADVQAVVFARMERIGAAPFPRLRGAIGAAISDNVVKATGEEARARMANPEAYEPRPMTALESLLLSTDGRTAPDEIRAAMRADADRSAA